MAGPFPPWSRDRIRRGLGMAALVLGVAVTGVFALRASHQWQYAQRVARGEIRVETLRGWMTLPYLARTYGVPEAQLRAALGLPAAGDADRSLREWFAVAGIDPVAGRRAIEDVILARQAPAREPPQ
jgi:hypothetical protein